MSMEDDVIELSFYTERQPIFQKVIVVLKWEYEWDYRRNSFDMLENETQKFALSSIMSFYLKLKILIGFRYNHSIRNQYSLSRLKLNFNLIIESFFFF